MYKSCNLYIDDIERIEIASNENLSIIKRATDSNDSVVRQRAYNKLCLFEYDNEIQGLLLKGINDVDELVRSDCLELLGEADLVGNIAQFIHALSDPDHYVVNSSIMCLTELEQDTTLLVNTLKKMLIVDQIHNSTMIRIHYALYVLNPSYSVDNVLNCLNESRDYRDRCAILNMLFDYCRSCDKGHILERIQLLIASNDFRAVLSNVDDLIEEFQLEESP